MEQARWRIDQLVSENSFLRGQVVGLTKSLGEIQEKYREEHRENKRLKWVLEKRLDETEDDDDE